MEKVSGQPQTLEGLYTKFYITTSFRSRFCVYWFKVSLCTTGTHHSFVNVWFPKSLLSSGIDSKKLGVRTQNGVFRDTEKVPGNSVKNLRIVTFRVYVFRGNFETWPVLGDGRNSHSLLLVLPLWSSLLSHPDLKLLVYECPTTLLFFLFRISS